MTAKKLEVMSISGAVLTVTAFFLVALLGGPLVRWFHLSHEDWSWLATVGAFVFAFLTGVSVGAAFVDDK